MLKVLNGAPIGDPTEKFTPRFLEQVPPAELTKALTNIRKEAFDGGRVMLVQVEDALRDDSLSGVITGEGSERYLSVFIALDDKTWKIAGLRFAPTFGGQASPADWNAFGGEAGKLKGGVSFGAYELVPRDMAKPKGALRLLPIYEFGEGKRLAIGSTFKLYVLGALAEEAAAGQLSWDAPLAIQDVYKSLPSGKMQDIAPGTEFSTSHFATQMISISDNTATDHLLHRVGRDKVEAYMSRLNGDPQRSFPFLTTFEMFTIKLSDDRTLAARYGEADEATRRDMLRPEGEVGKARPNILLAQAWNTPTEIERVEWFATAPECCQAMADLRRLEQLPGMEPLGKALRTNPGMPFDENTWTSVAFKGGSEPGVLNTTWLLERDDGRWFALSVGWNDPKSTLDQDRLLQLAASGVKLLEQEGRANAAPPPPAPPGDDGT